MSLDRIFDAAISTPIYERNGDAAKPAEGADGSSNHPGDDEDREDAATIIDTLPPFPEQAWRGPFDAYRHATERSSESSDAAKFGSLRAVAATCVRRRVHLQYGYRIYPNVYIVAYGGTGEAKTTAGRQAIQQIPLDARIKILTGIGSAEAFGDWLTRARPSRNGKPKRRNSRSCSAWTDER